MTAATSDRTIRQDVRGDDGFDLLGALLEEGALLRACVLPWLTVRELFSLAGINRACRRALAEVEGMQWLRSRVETGVHGRNTESWRLEACRLVALAAEEGAAVAAGARLRVGPADVLSCR